MKVSEYPKNVVFVFESTRTLKNSRVKPRIEISKSENKFSLRAVFDSEEVLEDKDYLDLPSAMKSAGQLCETFFQGEYITRNLEYEREVENYGK